MAKSIFEDIDAIVESEMSNIKLGDEKIVYEGFLKVKDAENAW
jgi:hypothetical protein